MSQSSETTQKPVPIDQSTGSRIWRQFRRRQAHGSDGIRLSVESPSGSENSTVQVEIRGWALALGNRKLEGRVCSNGEPVKSIQFNEIRDDVAPFFALVGEERRIGFQDFVTWDELGSGLTSTMLSLEFSDGKNTSSYGPIRVLRNTPPASNFSRGEYKSVWQSVSHDESSAMLSVAGTDNFQAFMESGISSAQTFKELLEIASEDVVLEIGCGVGRVGKSLSSECKRWIGTDISANMLEFAKENLRGHSSVELVELSDCSLAKFSDASIDKVYCSIVFMHLDEWDRYRYVTEAFRVLKPGGIFYFDNFNLRSETGWKLFEDTSSIDPSKRPPNVSKSSTEMELLTYAERAGFTDIRIYGSDQFLVGVRGTKVG